MVPDCSQMRFRHFTHSSSCGMLVRQSVSSLIFVCATSASKFTSCGVSTYSVNKNWRNVAFNDAKPTRTPVLVPPFAAPMAPSLLNTSEAVDIS
ncbi:unnamed protein product [Phytomonas sp. Hart1]|nr:unnamed protein product [Phytomonas sp. Hart1]|eukprot:CCW66152.1 unnamed protein product [Phytomonas sp. isolate Hart1]